jgi:hypothetical protein
MAVFTVIEHDEIGGGGAASWSETGISGSYDHLLLKASIRSEYVNSTADGVLQLNEDATTSLYSDTNLFARTTAVESTRTSSGAGITSWRMPAAWNVAEGDNVFGNLTVWIPNYANTANFKQVLLTSTFGPDDAQNYVWGSYVTAGLVQITGAITAVTVTIGGLGTGIAEFSTFTLYGITGA